MVGGWHKNLGRGQRIRKGVNRDGGYTVSEREKQRVGWRADRKIVESCGWGTVGGRNERGSPIKRAGDPEGQGTTG